MINMRPSKKPKTLRVAGPYNRIQQMARQLKAKPIRPYSGLLNKYFRKPATLENMWLFEKELEKKEQANSNKEKRAQATRDNYVARCVLGAKDTRFILRVCELKPENEKVFMETQIQKISKQRNITKKQAIQVLLKYAKKLEQTIDEKSKPLLEIGWNPKDLMAEPEKSAMVRHHFIGDSIQIFLINIGGFIEELERYN